MKMNRRIEKYERRLIVAVNAPFSRGIETKGGSEQE